MGLVDNLGWADALLYCIDRVFQKAGGAVGICRYILVAQPVLTRPLLSPRRAQSLAVRILQVDDELGDDTTLNRELLAKRIAAGNVCFGAFEAGRLVGFVCLGFERHDDELLHVRFIMPPTRPASWDYDFYIAPQHRLGFVYAGLWDSVFRFLHARGVEWSLSYIASTNKKSMNSQARMGAVNIGSLTVLRFGRCQAIIECRVPFVRIALGPDRPVEVRLEPPYNTGAEADRPATTAVT